MTRKELHAELAKKDKYIKELEIKMKAIERNHKERIEAAIDTAIFATARAMTKETKMKI